VAAFTAGILNSTQDDTEWSKLALKDGATFMLMGTSDPLPVQPTTKTVFVEDLAPEKDLGHPGGLVNLGNTCYLNSTIQYLRAVPELRQSLTQWRAPTGTDPGLTTTTAFRELITRMEGSATSVMPLEFLLVRTYLHLSLSIRAYLLRTCISVRGLTRDRCSAPHSHSSRSKRTASTCNKTPKRPSRS
jgi:hypothetical protein